MVVRFWGWKALVCCDYTWWVGSVSSLSRQALYGGAFATSYYNAWMMGGGSNDRAGVFHAGSLCSIGDPAYCYIGSRLFVFASG